MRTDAATIISALRILARDIESGDGVANAAISEAADRLEELQKGMADIHRWYERSVYSRNAGDPPETCCRILNQVDGIAKRCMK